uniref:SSD domain-containing protein n=1 Tax=Haemonchus contortus TaxID=6289 RepID=A0A7I4YSR2_HAECO
MDAVFTIRGLRSPFSSSKEDTLTTSTKEDQSEHGRLSMMQTAIFNRYCSIVLNHPWKTIIFTTVTSIILVALAIIFHYDTFDFDPVRGFETRGTTLANARMTLDALRKARATTTEILLSKLKKHVAKRQAKTFKLTNDLIPIDSSFKGNGWEKSRTVSPADGLALIESISINTTSVEAATIDYNDYGIDIEPKAIDLSDPCVQYLALETQDLYQYLDFTAKIIFQINTEETFSVDVFRRLCEVDAVIDRILKRSQYKPQTIPFITNSFNLPLYSNCLRLTTANRCDAINSQDIATLQSAVRTCRQDPLKPVCNPLIQQVNNYLLPKSMSNKKRHVAVLLKIPASDGRAGSYDFYRTLLDAFENQFVGDIVLKGASFNEKNGEFLHALQDDTKIAAVSAVLVLFCFLFYSRSFLYTFIILMIIFLSMGVAFFFYTVIFRIDFFPSLNMLVLVLMIGVGADDAFLLLVYYRRFRKAKEEPYQVGDPYVPLYKERDRVVRAVRNSLSHSLSSMFVTSATTAVAFVSNITSEIIVIRCFGIFASLTMTANYILVVLLLPSAMVLTCSEKRSRFVPHINVAPKISRLLYQGRFFVLLLGVATTIVASTIVFVSPGLNMPRYNPTKLLTNSHPYEWYDNNAHMFNFDWKRKWKLMENYVLGVGGEKSISLLSPYEELAIPFKEFHVNSATLTFIKNTVDMLIKQRGNPKYVSWAARFLSSNSSCMFSEKKQSIPSSCFLAYAAHDPPSPFPEDFAVELSDGPIFNKDLILIGYFVAIPSNKTLSLDSDEIENVAHTIETNCKRIMEGDKNLKIMCLSSSEITKYYDIIATLWSSTLFAVAISVAVSLLVVIVCTRRLILSLVSTAVITCVILWTTAVLILLGWELSVVESTIIVLTIGLSFDFTLHFAVSYRDESEKDIETRISFCLSSAGKACILSATQLYSLWNSYALCEYGCFRSSWLHATHTWTNVFVRRYYTISICADVYGWHEEE